MTNQDCISLASSCLCCKNAPCKQACPLGNDIPTIMSLVKQGEINKAFNELSKTTTLGMICGLVCPREKLCQGSCVRSKAGSAVEIGKVENFVAMQGNLKATSKIGKKVAIVGGGVSGISCALELAQKGVDVTIYEQSDSLGGATKLIPTFRLPSENHEKVKQLVNSLGIKVVKSTVGVDVTLQQLSSSYDAVYLANGLTVDNTMGIAGQTNSGVISATDYLSNPTAINALVVGGGNVALDCARTIAKLGGKATVVYRRTREQMPAFDHEIEQAINEGVEFKFLLAPAEIVGNPMTHLRCNCMQLSQVVDGRASVTASGEQQLLTASSLVVAIGYRFDKTVLNGTTIDSNSSGINVSDHFTGYLNIYGGGDITGNEQTAVSAVADGIKSARAIIAKW